MIQGGYGEEKLDVSHSEGLSVKLLNRPLERPFIISSAENLRQVEEKFAGGLILIIFFRDLRGFITKFIQLNAMAITQFFVIQVWCLFKGSVYTRVVLM